MDSRIVELAPIERNGSVGMGQELLQALMLRGALPGSRKCLKFANSAQPARKSAIWTWFDQRQNNMSMEDPHEKISPD
jgi:hypothetical protein